MANQLRPVMTNHHRDHLQLGHAHRSYRPRGTSNQRHSSTVTAYSSVPFCYMLQLLLLAYTPTISNGEVVAPSTTPITTLLTTYETLPKPANYLQPDAATAAAAEGEELPMPTLCDKNGGIVPLGMESETIPDSALTASSAFEMLHVGPHNARLGKDKAGGAWCPSKQLGPDTSGSEWIQVDLDQLYVITGVATQGRFGKGLGQEFTEWYNILYSRERNPSKWIKWKSLDGRTNLEGNIDPNTVEEQHLELPIVAARHLRIVPLSNHTRTVCLRFELFGCRYYGPISYTSPAVPIPKSELTDFTYDGQVSAGEYTGGLGQLIDGLSPNNSKQDYLWVGWPGSAEQSSAVNLEFQFDQIYNFSTVKLNINRDWKQNVGGFRQAVVWFSLDNLYWSQTPIRADYPPDGDDHANRLALDIPIHLQFRIGRFVRVELTFEAKWLQLSEIIFDCTPLERNLTESQKLDLLEHGYRTLAYSDESSGGGGTRYVMPEDSGSNHSRGKGFYPVPQNHSYNQTVVKYSLIIACLCILGLVMISLLTSVALKKLNTRKNNVFEEIAEADYESDVNTTINLKSIESSSPLYCDPKEIDSDQIEAEYAVPDVICASALSKTLNFQKNATSALGCKTLQINPRFYASSDIIHPKQNIYGTRPQILNVFDMANFRRVNPQQKFPQQQQQQQQQQQTPLLDTFGGGAGSLWRSSIYGDVINGQFGVRVYSEAEIGVLQSLGKSKFGDILLCNVSTASGKNRLVVVRTVNDLNLKSEFLKSMDYGRKLAQNCEKFSRLLGIIDMNTYFASITEYADCDLNYFLRKSSPDSLSYEALVYLASEIANACAYLETMKQVHQDLATRNVIIYEKNLVVKVTDVAAYLDKYSMDYFNGLPIRWMSPEAIVRTEFSIESDVYAFGVCFWEILTYAKCRPFVALADEDLLATVYAHLDQEEELPQLPRPANCPLEMYELLQECWDPTPSQRPTFKEISLFLQRKTMTFTKPPNH